MLPISVLDSKAPSVPEPPPCVRGEQTGSWIGGNFGSCFSWGLGLVFEQSHKVWRQAAEKASEAAPAEEPLSKGTYMGI